MTTTDEDGSTEVMVSVDDAHMRDVGEVAARLRDAGLAIDELLEELGVITGHIEASKASALLGVEGVSRVEQTRAYELAPPDADIQ